MQKQRVIHLPDERATQKLGQLLAKVLYAPCTILFYGEIGAGKTSLIRSILTSMGIQSVIKSPTFSIVESYTIHDMDIHHFDLYRIHDISEIDYIGFRDYFTENALCMIEWPERAAHALPDADIEIYLTHHASGRDILIKVPNVTKQPNVWLSIENE